MADRVCCLREHEDEPPDVTANHGTWVSSISNYYAPDSSFYFYLAGDEQAGGDEESRVRIPHLAFARAVNVAIEHGVDVLNVSAGTPKPECTHGQCVYCSEAKRAVDSGITVIASAGNDPDACVHCPSNAVPVISVGGVEFECTYNMPRAPNNPTNKPPLAYWTRMWSGYEAYPDSASGDPYCTTRGCWSNDGSCEQYMTVTEWDRNPIPSGDKPDLLAPVHYAEEKEDQYPFVWAASSFAAPVVSGCLAGILSTLDSSPSPFAIQQAVRDGSTPVESSIAGIFDAAETQALLSE